MTHKGWCVVKNQTNKSTGQIHLYARDLIDPINNLDKHFWVLVVLARNYNASLE